MRFFLRSKQFKIIVAVFLTVVLVRFLLCLSEKECRPKPTLQA